MRVGLTQKALAGRMGSSQSIVARLEAGGVSPTIETLERVAAALGARLDITLRIVPSDAETASDAESSVQFG